MKPITAENRTTGSPTYVPLPWHVFAAFWRLVWVGFVVAFGPYSGRKANEAQEPDNTSPDATLVHTEAIDLKDREMDGADLTVQASLTQVPGSDEILYGNRKFCPVSGIGCGPSPAQRADTRYSVSDARKSDHFPPAM